MDILSVPDPTVSAEDAFKVCVDLDIIEFEFGVVLALEKLRVKLPTLSSKGRRAVPWASADLA